MKIRNIITMAMFAIASIIASAQDPWLHLYYPSVSNYKQIPMDQVLDISFDEAAGTMTINSDTEGSQTIQLSAIDRFVIGANNCRIDVETDMKVFDSQFPSYEGQAVTDIVSKTIYLDGTLYFDGRGIYENVECPVKIRGRGNSTWTTSGKRPYRLKFTEKQKLGPIHKAKNLVLLANALDGSFMKNFAAFAFGKLIDMPYINRALPVDMYINGNYKGTYLLTEKVGINNGSVDLPKEDEPNSILVELDTNGAEEDEYPHNDIYFGVPTRLKDPDAPTDAAELTAWTSKWHSEIDDFFGIVNNGVPEEMYAACNLDVLVRYIMVFNMACNQELDHPKSIYMHKTDGQQWEFGPCWDFDWAYGYYPIFGSNGSYKNPLIRVSTWGSQKGNHFFYALCHTDQFLSKFKEIWDDFYQNKQDEFWRQFDEYAEMLEPTATLQGNSSWKTDVQTLRMWIKNRFDYINSDQNYGLWD